MRSGRRWNWKKLCHETGLNAPRVGGKLASTAFELGIDASPFIASLQSFPVFLQTALTMPGMGHVAFNAMGFFPQMSVLLHRAPPDESVSKTEGAEPSEDIRRRGPNRRAVRGERVRSREALRACEQMIRARKCWRLAQREFAGLFMTTVRTVRRWEHREFAPTPHQQWFLRVLSAYANIHGLREFRARFVR